MRLSAAGMPSCYIMRTLGHYVYTTTVNVGMRENNTLVMSLHGKCRSVKSLIIQYDIQEVL